MTQHPILLLLLVAGAACGPAPRPRGPSDADLRLLSENNALAILAEVAGEVDIACGQGWRIDIGEGADKLFEVDLQLRDSGFGVEWVTGQDRADWGATIPDPDPSGQLRIMAGVARDASAQILVLHERSYRFDPDSERVRAGSTGAREAEDRLRRDMRDFLEYVRGQGAL